jgi:hypothetical protein
MKEKESGELKHERKRWKRRFCLYQKHMSKGMGVDFY